MNDDRFPILQAGNAEPSLSDMSWPARHATTEHSVMSSEQAPAGHQQSSNRMPQNVAFPNDAGDEGPEDI